VAEPADARDSKSRPGNRVRVRLPPSAVLFQNSKETDMDNTVCQTEEKTVLSAIAESRVIVSRIFGFAILMLLVFTGHSFSQNGIVDMLFEIFGLFLLSVCSLGRLWALMYISGNKKRLLITDGPYSMVRNPLYVFSLVGALGIGLASENMLVLALIAVFYSFYYPFTIFAEEKKLIKKFGQAYLEYMKKTPRFLPKLSLHKEPAIYTINARSFAKNFIYGMWFVWIFMLIDVLEKLQDLGYIPVIARFP
jgi:protein-S-isoprenylcysteine O-methyltransferase Ste14